MIIKLTESKLENLVDTLNAIICGEVNITREQRENMVRTVATLGGLTERQRLITEEKEAKKQAQEGKVKKPLLPDEVFPRSGKPWVEEDIDLIHSIITDIPDDRIDDHVLWLSKKLERTPYAITIKIVSEGRMNEVWAKGWKPAAKSIREDFALVRAKSSTNSE
ncbi:hypothetical protein A6J71_00185 [Enterobacter cancerogenus]|uniref:hypothetical protein n=1 Tax=Enterobacter cancerogenus TaxID=69218 RepID=UPI000C9A79E9|nr:hypothetical protein [Enterobacter cancerogenus]PNF13490.1 hypothetical protein A6J71_00185 [Enterobacter cancerogenus]